MAKTPIADAIKKAKPTVTTNVSVSTKAPTSAERKRESSERNAKEAATAAKVWRQERAAEDAERAAYHTSVTSR